MKRTIHPLILCAAALALPLAASAGATLKTNPPSECQAAQSSCGCAKNADEGGKDDAGGVSSCPDGGSCASDEPAVDNDCVKIRLDLGRTAPWTGSMSCSLKLFADDEASDIFHSESLYPSIGGYTFKRLGQKTMPDGRTPAEVVMNHPRGEPVHFIFRNDESWGMPDPGVHIEMDERLMMVDAEGWATTSDPVYWDLYVGDGTRRRFLASGKSGRMGALVSFTDARGVTVTPQDMGVDLVYDEADLRQMLTPCRLAHVDYTSDWTGYDISIYPLTGKPRFDETKRLYDLPSGNPVSRLGVRPGKDGKSAVVTVAKGGGEPKTYTFEYLMGEWSLVRPSGVREEKERFTHDMAEAQIVKTVKSASNAVLSRRESNFKWESWGFAMTNRVEGYDGVTETTSWTYYKSGNGKGRIKSELRQSGLLIEYAYDSDGRVTMERRSGPGMMTEETAYSYTPVDAADPVLAVDTRPRTIIKTIDGIECERTYYAYTPLTNIVERVGEQGSAYGGTNALRTITAYYPAVEGDMRSGFVKSMRHENGRIDAYDYALASNAWTRTVTHLHEQAPEPVNGRTTRDVTVQNALGYVTETRIEAFIEDAWHVIARNRMTYNLSGKVVRKENLAGQVTITDWDCCHRTHEIQPDGSATAWDYDDEGRLVETSRLIPLDLTNQTWVSTCYRYDDLGRQTATWQTNATMHVGLPAIRTAYDPLGRVTNRVDVLGNNTTTSYSADGRTLSVHNPNTSTRITSRSADGDIISITGSAVTSEFHTYGILPDGTRWTKIVQGETAESPRFAKRYENMLGQTVREERSGFQGATLATVYAYDSYGRLVSVAADGDPSTEYAYDTLGNRIATTRMVGRPNAPQPTGGSPSPATESGGLQFIATAPMVPMVGRVAPNAPQPTEWRKSETASCFAVLDGAVWLVQSNAVSCSDAIIAPLVTSKATQLPGLSAANPSRSRTTDVRGNATETETFADAAGVVSRQTLPHAANSPLSLSRYGVEVMNVSVSAVTNAYAYDALGRSVATTDGRGNTSRIEYNALGQRSASIDALGNRTTYAYDQFGNLASVTDPLGNATVYEYDLRGRKTYEGGATYPVRYTYDVSGNKTTMMTYRNESLGPDSGDVTTWLYDEAGGAMTNKVYADGKGPTYSYTPDGKLSRRIWARGIVTDYAYDGWGNLTNTVYSDETPTVSLVYDALGRQTETRDAAGVTTFAYDAFGSLTNETVVGVAGTNTIERYWDAYGRTSGYALNGERQTAIGYDPATGRMETMRTGGTGILPVPDEEPFRWSYVPGSDLKAQLQYPNGLTASWQYDAAGQLLQVCNATPTNVISQYDYTYDAAGRRIACAQSGTAFGHADAIAYAYNERSELTNAVASADADYRYAYRYDDIGNRVWSIERETNVLYTANSLNQYTAIDDFRPEYDADGNQTLIKTATGIWRVAYNGENRPVFWSNGFSNVVMSYDRSGRRARCLEMVDPATNVDKTFTYDNYVCIAQHRGQSTGAMEIDRFIWDLTEPVATRPLVLNYATAPPAYYTLDGNKNVSELVLFQKTNCVVSHYEYSPWGAIRAKNQGTGVTTNDLSILNPLTFSSEYFDAITSLVYYNYRHYNPLIGNWCARDIIEENGGLNLFEMVGNNTCCRTDALGWGWTFRYGIPVYLYKQCCGGEDFDPAKECCINNKKYSFEKIDTGVSYYCEYRRFSGAFMIIIRPFSPGQWFLSHCWFAVGDDRFGAYPSEEGGLIGQLVKGIGGEGDTIKDERKLKENHPASEGGFLVFKSTVRLSECGYDLDKFNACIQSKNPNNKNANPKWNWTLPVSDCRDFVLDSIEECKQEAQRK